MNYLSIVILLTYCFTQEISFPKENIQNLGKGWYQVTSWVEIHDDIRSAEAKEQKWTPPIGHYLSKLRV